MKYFVLVFLVVMTHSAFAGPKAGSNGIGLVLGEPTGLSAKTYVTETQAIDAALSYSLRTDSIWLHGDYLFHSNKMSRRVHGGQWVPYGGVGALLYFSDSKKKQDTHALVAARGPLGLMFYLEDAPVELFAEVALIVGILPETAVGLGGGLGGRYLF